MKVISLVAAKPIQYKPGSIDIMGVSHSFGGFRLEVFLEAEEVPPGAELTAQLLGPDGELNDVSETEWVMSWQTVFQTYFVLNDRSCVAGPHAVQFCLNGICVAERLVMLGAQS